jgi:Sulfatase-modifying factor enzyme 1
MVMVPAGNFIMGSPASEEARLDHEQPQRKVIVVRPFAAGRVEITFDEWDARSPTAGAAPCAPPRSSGSLLPAGGRPAAQGLITLKFGRVRIEDAVSRVISAISPPPARSTGEGGAAT